ncbi:MAG TPA: hypothetical protein ENH82_04765 [bacterium]|nr:hypothetical protein [bacterium]
MRFSKEYRKLKSNEFTTIRKNTGFHSAGCSRLINTPSDRFRATVVKAIPITKDGITEKIAMNDADCSRDDLISMLEGWYGKKFDDYVLLTLRKV